MGKHGKPAEFRVKGKVKLSKSTEVVCKEAFLNQQEQLKVDKPPFGYRVCVGFVGLGIAILIGIGWVLLGDWLATLLGEKTGFLALNLILLVVVAIKAAWDNFFDVGEGSS